LAAGCDAAEAPSASAPLDLTSPRLPGLPGLALGRSDLELEDREEDRLRERRLDFLLLLWAFLPPWWWRLRFLPCDCRLRDEDDDEDE
jgi:hypothetical protein